MNVLSDEYLDFIESYLNSHEILSSIFHEELDQLFREIDSYVKRNHLYNVKSYGELYNFNYHGNGYEIKDLSGPDELHIIRKVDYSDKYFSIYDVRENRLSPYDAYLFDKVEGIFDSISELDSEGVPLDYLKKDTTNLIRRLKHRKK